MWAQLGAGDGAGGDHFLFGLTSVGGPPMLPPPRCKTPDTSLIGPPFGGVLAERCAAQRRAQPGVEGCSLGDAVPRRQNVSALSAHSVQSVSSWSVERRAPSTSKLLGQAARVQAGPAAANLRAAQQAFEHSVEVVVAVGELLTRDGAGHGVADQEDAHLDIVALAQRAREAQRVVGALAAVGLVVDDDQDVHHGIVALRVDVVIGSTPDPTPWNPAASSGVVAGMSHRTQSPETAVSAATIAIALP